MLTPDATAQAAIDSDARGITPLVEMDFSTGTQRFTLWPVDVVSGGNTYQGIGALGNIAGLSESEDRSAKKVTLSFKIVNTAMLAACIGPANVYRRKRVRVYVQFMDSLHRAAGASILRWQGYMDQTSVERATPGDLKGGGSGSINMHCSRVGTPMSMRSVGLRSTHQQQTARFAGDLGLEYQQTLLEKPSLWLSKRFQEV